MRIPDRELLVKELKELLAPWVSGDMHREAAAIAIADHIGVPPQVLPGEQCWCGGPVGRREPGDVLGVGCLTDIAHDWCSA